MADFGAARSELGIYTPEAVVLAAPRTRFPVLSIVLAEGKVNRLGDGHILALTRFESDVWGLFRDRAVQYRGGRERGLVLKLPEGLGTPQVLDRPVSGEIPPHRLVCSTS